MRIIHDFASQKRFATVVAVPATEHGPIHPEVLTIPEHAPGERVLGRGIPRRLGLLRALVALEGDGEEGVEAEEFAPLAETAFLLLLVGVRINGIGTLRDKPGLTPAGERLQQMRAYLVPGAGLHAGIGEQLVGAAEAGIDQAEKIAHGGGGVQGSPRAGGHGYLGQLPRSRAEFVHVAHRGHRISADRRRHAPRRFVLGRKHGRPTAKGSAHLAALKAADRSRCGQVAPPDGLYLVGVDY